MPATTWIAVVALVASIASFAWTELRLRQERKARRAAGPVPEILLWLDLARRTFNDLRAGGQSGNWFMIEPRRELADRGRLLVMRAQDDYLQRELTAACDAFDGAFAVAPLPTPAGMRYRGRMRSVAQDSSQARDADNVSLHAQQREQAEQGLRAVDRAAARTADLELTTR